MSTSDGRKESYKTQNYVANTRSKNLQRVFLLRNHMRNDCISRRRAIYFTAETPHNFKVVNVEQDMNQDVESLELNNNQIVGDILCCRCGKPSPPNKASMCNFCLRLECNVEGVLPSRVNIIHCHQCSSYLQPPRTWLKAERESKELLAFCLTRLKKLSKFRLIDAKFLPTEAKSKRIKLRLKVQSEVLNQVYVETSHDVEYVVCYQKCRACMPADSNSWEAVVQVRQKISHMRTFFALEQLIIKHNAAMNAVKIKQEKDGINFYFAKKIDAARLFAFLIRVVPIKPQKFHEKILSRDTRNVVSYTKWALSAIISPVCYEDLVYIPSKLTARIGRFGPLMICTKLTSSIFLLDPVGLQRLVLSCDQYWRAPFEPLLSSTQLVEYIVLDVEIVSSEIESRWLGGYTQADVEIARVSDFGKNDRISRIRTHLGHVLKPGDHALGYDLENANFNNSEAEGCRASFPDAVLIKKVCEEKLQVPVKDSLQKKNDSEYEKFLKDLEANPELRFNVSLEDNTQKHTEMASTVASDPDDDPFSQLEDVFARIVLSDEE